MSLEDCDGMHRDGGLKPDFWEIKGLIRSNEWLDITWLEITWLEITWLEIAWLEV